MNKHPLLVAALLSLSPALLADTVDRGGTTIQSYDGNLHLTCNPNWGGACVSIQWKGTEFINCSDAGRECQIDTFIGYNNGSYTPWTDVGTTLSGGNTGSEVAQNMVVPTGKGPNPTECGDGQDGRASYPSPLDWWSANGTTIQSYTRSREYSWNRFFSSDTRGHIFGAISGAKDVLKKSVWIPAQSYGFDNVIKFEGWLRNPTTGDIHGETPALYVQPSYNKFIGYDVTTGAETSLASGANYNPSIGGVIVYDGNRNDRCIGTFGANGLNPTWKFQVTQFGNLCSKIRANSPWVNNAAKGTVVYGYCFVVCGDNVAHVESTMRALYAKGWY